MPSPNLEQISALTLKHYSNKLADNITKNTVILQEFKKEGAYKTVSGGTSIVEQIEYDFNNSFGWYSGAEGLNQTVNETFSAAEFDWKQASVNITNNGLEMLMNAGKEQLIDLAEAKIKNAERKMADGIGTSMYGTGTGSGGKEIGGLQLLVPDDPTTGTVGNINRATWSFWRTRKFGGVADGGAAVSATTIVKYMNRLWLNTKRGNDLANKIFTDYNYFNFYLDALSAYQQIVKVTGASAIEQDLVFNGVPVMADALCPANHMYFINTKYIKFRPHVDRNFVTLAKRESVNQDASIQYIVFAGNMTISAPYHGVLIA